MEEDERLVSLAQQRELNWLLEEINQALKTNVLKGLKECFDLLQDHKDELKIVMSSTKSEVLKGIVTRQGTRIEQCDLVVRLHSVNKGRKPFVISLNSAVGGYPLKQLVEASGYVEQALVCTGELHQNTSTSDRQPVGKAMEGEHSGGLSAKINGASDSDEDNSKDKASGPSYDNDSTNEQTRLCLLQNLHNIKDARQALHGPDERSVFPYKATDLNQFHELCENVSVDFYVADSNIVTDIRTYGPVQDEHSIFSFFTGSAKHFGNSNNNNNHSSSSSSSATSSNKPVDYDGRQVVEHERVVVGNQDPTLISATSKLCALESYLEQMAKKLELCLL